MIVQKSVAAGLLILAGSLAAAPSMAGPYADDMAKCLVKSASPQDRSLLVKWIFAVISSHPDLASMSAVTAAQRDALDKSAAALYQRLLLESCKTETQDAIQNEGPQTMEYAFSTLGQVATRGMFTDPNVLAGMKNFTKYFDQDKLKAVLQPSAAAKPQAAH